MDNNVEYFLQVRASGKYNFLLCRIPVNFKINFDRFNSLLSDYNDKIITDYLKYGFPACWICSTMYVSSYVKVNNMTNLLDKLYI